MSGMGDLIDETLRSQAVKILRRTVTNDGDRLMLLFVEMEGWDCWLRPGESVELRADVEFDQDDFDFADCQHGMVVYPSNGMGMITVHQGNKELDCAHQRPDWWP